MRKKTVGIIGAGRLGGALAARLRLAGWPLAGLTAGVYEHAEAAARRLGTAAFAANHELAAVSDILFLTVPDGVIVDAARDALSREVRPGTALIHCSGALSYLALPEDNRVRRGSLHPLQSFADPTASWDGIYCAIEGDAAVLPLLQDVCRTLGANFMTVPAEDKALYHAAACIASNHLVTLLSLAEDLFGRWADGPQAARASLRPLVTGTLANYERLGAARALTGPVARGDAGTVARHFKILPAAYRELYRLLSRHTLELARRAGKISEERAEKIREVIEGSGNDGK
jgi:predicted short-subunit dehydrogenase-like oxidoreductase (DUF2520 family)